MHQVRFEKDSADAWSIYDLATDRPIGEILGWVENEWIGRMGIDGYVATLLGTTAEKIGVRRLDRGGYADQFAAVEN